MSTRRPLLMMTASAVSFAIMAFAAKLASARLSGSEIAFFRFVIMLVPLLAVPRLGRKALEFQRVDLLVYRGVFGGVAVLLYFVAIAHIPVGLATLFNYSSPIFSVFFAALFLDEPVDGRFVVPLLMALAGLFFVATGGQGANARFHIGTWEIVAIVSSVLSGAALAAIRAARRTEGSWAVYGSFSICGLVASAPFALSGFGAPTSREWFFLTVVGVGSVVAQLLMTWAYRWVTNLQAGVVMELTVVVSMLLGVVFLGDRLTAVQLWGSVLTLAGVLGVTWIQATPRAVE